MIKAYNSTAIKTPVLLTGVVFLVMLLLLGGCQTGKSPEEVTTLFWQDLAKGKLDNARQHVTNNSKHLVNLQDIDKFSQVTAAEAEENNDSESTFASVPTTINRNNQLVSFNTVLLQEDNRWKIDYLQTQLNITMIPLGDVVKTLQNLGGTFARQLGQQLPIIQKEMESLGNELKKQINEFNRNFDKSYPHNQPKQNRNTI